MTEAETLKLVERYLNEAHPGLTVIKSIDLMLKLPVLPLLAWIYEEGKKDKR